LVVIAVTGKGGTGKTVISALLINHFSSHKSVLAVDADPDSNLPMALGIEEYKTLGDIRELFQRSRDEMGTISKEQWLEGKIYGEAVNEGRNFDLLVMGQPEGDGCYCFVNNLLRGVLRKLLKNYEVVVIDCEAGLEHFSRKTIDNADYVLVVTDKSKKGLSTAKRIKNSSVSLNMNFEVSLLGNMVNSGKEEAIKMFAEKAGIRFLGTLPYSEEISELDFNGEPIIIKDNKFKEMFENLIKKIGGNNDN